MSRRSSSRAASASQARSPELARAAAVDVEMQDGSGGEEDGAGEEEEDGLDEGEYEIEKILSHDIGIYGEGKVAYFVSWVGYSSEDDSWVTEEDAEGAADMLAEYWRSRTIPKKVRTISNTAARVWEEQEQKRATKGRSSQRGRDSLDPTASKKSSKLGKRKARLATDEESSDEDIDLSTLSPGERTMKLKKRARRRYEKIVDWENIVKCIDTIYKDTDGRNIAAVRFEDGSVFAYDTAVVNHRCPQKVIQLYESRLRFRPNPRGDAQPVEHFQSTTAAADAVEGRQSAGPPSATNQATASPAAAAIHTGRSSSANSQDVSIEAPLPAASHDATSDNEASQAAAPADSQTQETQEQGDKDTAQSSRSGSRDGSAGPLRAAVDTAKEVAVAMTHAIGMEPATEPSESAPINGAASGTAAEASAATAVNGDAGTQADGEASGSLETVEPPSDTVQPSAETAQLAATAAAEEPSSMRPGSTISAAMD